MTDPVSPLAMSIHVSAFTADIDAGEEKATIGFAELLFRSPPPAPPKSGGWWGHGSSADLAGGRGADWGDAETDSSPWWLKATVFVAGSMMAGAVCAHLMGDALWQKNKPQAVPNEPPHAQAPAVPGSAKSVKKPR